MHLAYYSVSYCFFMKMFCSLSQSLFFLDGFFSRLRSCVRTSAPAPAPPPPSIRKNTNTSAWCLVSNAACQLPPPTSLRSTAPPAALRSHCAEEPHSLRRRRGQAYRPKPHLPGLTLHPARLLATVNTGSNCKQAPASTRWPPGQLHIPIEQLHSLFQPRSTFYTLLKKCWVKWVK